MELLMYAVAFVAGGLLSHLVFGGTLLGPFEKTIWYGLGQGKEVVVSIADEAYIFKMNGTKLQITRGSAMLMEAEDGVDSPDMVGSGTVQPSGTDGLSH